MCTIFHLLAVAVKYEPEYTNNTWKEKKEGKGGAQEREYCLQTDWDVHTKCSVLAHVYEVQ